MKPAVRSKLHSIQIQAILVDEDEDGTNVQPVPLEPFTAINHAQALGHLADIKSLLADRTAELQAAAVKPNRAARRARQKP